MNNELSITQNDIDTMNEAQEQPVAEPVTEGLVVDNNEITNSIEDSNVYVPGGLTPDVMDSVNSYIENTEKELNEFYNRKNEEDSEEDEESEDENEQMFNDPNVVTMDSAEYQEKVEKASIIINKANLTVGDLGLTPEEHEKLETVRTIEINEIEEVDLASIKIVPFKKKQTDKIIEKVNSPMKTNVVLVASGYTAVMRGCSVYELMDLFIDKDSGMTSTFITKWTILHKCIVSTSIGKLTFDEFLKHTAFSDMDMLIWGVLSATYPRMDTYTYECSARSKTKNDNSCGNKIEIRYYMKNLLRGELLSDRMLNMISEIVDKSTTEEGAREVHNNSLVMAAKRFRLPDTGIVATLQMKSAYDMIYNLAKSLDGLNKMDKEKYQNASILSISIHDLLIPTEDGDGYYEIKESIDVIQAIYNLSEMDNAVLIKMANAMNEGTDYVFGFNNVQCSKCGNVHQIIKMPIEQMLFHKYQRAMQIQ